jgi:hypothetical protein
MTLMATSALAADRSDAGAAEPESAAAPESAERGTLAGPPMPVGARVVTAPRPAPDWRGAWAFDSALVASGQLADLASTEYALTRETLREANPLLGRRAVRIPAKLAVAAFGSWATHRLRKQGHHGRARALSIVAFAIGAGMAVHNVRLAREHR